MAELDISEYMLKNYGKIITLDIREYILKNYGKIIILEDEDGRWEIFSLKRKNTHIVFFRKFPEMEHNSQDFIIILKICL
jgi:hypothetical protein